ncbi:hypothetical protein [Salirhabdus sp. Marseille-P4669]|uniref:hypothetical protein n=1 Tax=Salirhabdus sp. Marseille-P4669 TaxID=2042310 RepID=UPI000C7E5ADD|nr:hypothetical protein [Salirhabdus sp. Marseille-P4669]
MSQHEVLNEINRNIKQLTKRTRKLKETVQDSKRIYKHLEERVSHLEANHKKDIEHLQELLAAAMKHEVTISINDSHIKELLIENKTQE